MTAVEWDQTRKQFLAKFHYQSTSQRKALNQKRNYYLSFLQIIQDVDGCSEEQIENVLEWLQSDDNENQILTDDASLLHVYLMS